MGKDLQTKWLPHPIMYSKYLIKTLLMREELYVSAVHSSFAFALNIFNYNPSYYAAINA